MAERRMTGESFDDGAGFPRADLGADNTTQPTSAVPQRADSELRADGDRADRTPADADDERDRDRRMRRARFLAELDEARELRKRVAPRRARAAELHARVLRTFRY